MKTPLTLFFIGDILSAQVNLDKAITGIHFDSRKVGPSALFFALKGERVDGHTFLEDVASKQAIAAVVAKSYRGPSFGLELLRVDDPLKALQKLATWHIENSDALCIGITGSIGKTTSKEFIKQLLQSEKKVLASEGSYNSQAGLPYSLINQWNGPGIVVAEMGISQKGEMEKLTAMINPHIALLTRLVVTHTKQLEDVESIAHEKCKLFAAARIQKGVFHQSTLAFDAVKALKIPKVSYALNDISADYTLTQKEEKVLFYERGTCVNKVALHLRGSGVLENVLAAYALCREVGLSSDVLISQMKYLALAPHRFNFIEKKGVTFIDDSYNASPYSVKAALKNMGSSTKRRIAVLGSMGELGAFEKDAHREVVETAIKSSDELFFLGQEWNNAAQVEQDIASRIFLTKKGLQEALFALIKSGDTVLIKGANSHQMWQLIEAY